MKTDKKAKLPRRKSDDWMHWSDVVGHWVDDYERP
jgi:hypothetical protein